MLRPGQKIQKRNKVDLSFLCTAIPVIARHMHTKFGVIWTYDDKGLLRTRNALYNQSKGLIKKEKVELGFLCTTLPVIA